MINFGGRKSRLINDRAKNAEFIIALRLSAKECICGLLLLFVLFGCLLCCCVLCFWLMRKESWLVLVDWFVWPKKENFWGFCFYQKKAESFRLLWKISRPQPPPRGAESLVCLFSFWLVLLVSRLNFCVKKECEKKSERSFENANAIRYEKIFIFAFVLFFPKSR